MGVLLDTSRFGIDRVNSHIVLRRLTPYSLASR